ncbi:hypothetical protein NE237_033254 [Protea cynaroides]|uniref:Peptide N-acetyl-beta-D-glucosaminyl asparaginase amidase A N-terminal domain-containing protein n=1 Tax=Protea cynaroides TaxID=273540 RepID=A0A9Q0L4P5_9MAGN|nr:hypothetical protein NE237_033254 [Protea cynaroides]
MSSSLLILFFSLFILHLPFACNANLTKANRFRSELLPQPSLKDASITRYFEVTKPMELPKTKSCSYLILQHDFGFTFTQPPVLANYTPPLNCSSQGFSKIVLEWTATCKILRSCTAEPRATGIVWTIKKDITRYSSLLKNPQTLAVYLGNLVDQTYTGIYHVNITFHFYPAELPQNPHKQRNSEFKIPQNAYRAVLEVYVSFQIPQNAYRAVLEVYVSFHSDDAFWEVVVSLNGSVVGAIWPFTVIYTGGIYPLLWRPITGIGSFNLPSYDIEITPFLGKILDGNLHKFGFSVTNALDVWYIDANLHLWLDSNRERTEGKLIKHRNPRPQLSLVQHFMGLNGSFITSASRSLVSSGWVKSSHGKITTYSVQDFSFRNSMEMKDNFNFQIFNQTIEANNSVFMKLPSSFVYSVELMQRFPFYLYSANVDQGNGSFLSLVNLSLGFNEDRFSTASFGFSTSSLRNLQNGQVNMFGKGNLVVSALGSTQQVYAYDSNEECYSRNVSSKNYPVLYDEKREICDR